MNHFLISVIIMVSSTLVYGDTNTRCEYSWRNLKGTVNVTTKKNGVDVKETCSAKITILDTSPCHQQPILDVTTQFYCPSETYTPISMGRAIRGNELWSNWHDGSSTPQKVGIYTEDKFESYLGCSNVEIRNLNSTNNISYKLDTYCGNAQNSLVQTATGTFSY